MKKVLLAFDGGNFSQGAFDFVRRLNELEPLLLVGSFLPRLDISSSWSYSVGNIAHTAALMEDLDPDIVQQNIARFRSQCHSHSIECRVHKFPFDLAIPELRKESRFADVLILGSESFYHQLGFEAPNEYMRMVIQDSECPVIVVPEHFPFPKSVLLAYDGSRNAVFAIKQFACLFPSFSMLDATLLYASPKKQADVPDEEFITELVARHYPRLTVKKLEDNPGHVVYDLPDEPDDPIMVCGSYGRSDLSLMFKKSFAADIINERKIPLFIAHF